MYISIVASALLAPMLIASAMPSIALTYKASCTGDQVVPPVASKATGSVSITLVNKTYATGYFYATNIKQMTQAHLHAGAAGKNGPVIVWALNASYGPLSGSVKASFSFNPSVNKVTSALLAAGLVYFNIHTTAHPAGDLRGQLVSTSSPFQGISSPPPLPDGSYKETCLSVDDVMCEMIADPNRATNPSDPKTWLFCGACFYNAEGVMYSPDPLDLTTCAQPPYVSNDVNKLALTCPHLSSPPSPPPPVPPPPPLCKSTGIDCSHDSDCCSGSCVTQVSIDAKKCGKS